MSITVSKEEVIGFEKLKAISQIAPIKERIRGEKEDFEKWDDYIEWKAYIESLKDLEWKMKDIEDAQDVRIT